MFWQTELELHSSREKSFSKNFDINVTFSEDNFIFVFSILQENRKNEETLTNGKTNVKTKSFWEKVTFIVLFFLFLFFLTLISLIIRIVLYFSQNSFFEKLDHNFTKEISLKSYTIKFITFFIEKKNSMIIISAT